MDVFLASANIRLLRDEAVLLGGEVYLYGRPDAQRPGRGVEVRKTPAEFVEGLDAGKPILVLDHQPRELEALAAAGVDVDLCGHTHDGQMFPGNLTSLFYFFSGSSFQSVKPRISAPPTSCGAVTGSPSTVTETMTATSGSM